MDHLKLFKRMRPPVGCEFNVLKYDAHMIIPLGSFRTREEAAEHAKNIIDLGFINVVVVEYGDVFELSNVVELPKVLDLPKVVELPILPEVVGFSKTDQEIQEEINSLMIEEHPRKLSPLVQPKAAPRRTRKQVTKTPVKPVVKKSTAKISLPKNESHKPS